MKLFTKFRFFIGIMVTILIVGMLTLYLNNIMSVAHAYRAELAADTLTVGVDYPGQIVKQSVSEGDLVKKGDPLFTIRSTQFSEAYKKNAVDTTGLNFSVDDNGDMVLSAGVDGVVEAIQSQNGAYVAAGTVIASINSADSVYVVGHYKLNPPDYSRINKGDEVTVTLPDNTRHMAQVFAINLERKGETVDTVVKARLVSSDLQNFRFAVGTPVESDLRINDKPWYQTILEITKSLIEPVGN